MQRRWIDNLSRQGGWASIHRANKNLPRRSSGMTKMVVAFYQQRRSSAIAALYAYHGPSYAPTFMFPPPHFDSRRSVFYRASPIYAPNVFTGITAPRHLTSIATHTAIQRRARTPLEQLVPATAPRSGMRANRLPPSPRRMVRDTITGNASINTITPSGNPFTNNGFNPRQRQKSTTVT